MYAGRIVESAAAAELFRHARHPYTAELLKCVPEPVGPAAGSDCRLSRAAAAAGRLCRRVRIRAALSARRRTLPGGAAAASRVEGGGGALESACHFPLSP